MGVMDRLMKQDTTSMRVEDKISLKQRDYGRVSVARNEILAKEQNMKTTASQEVVYKSLFDIMDDTLSLFDSRDRQSINVLRALSANIDDEHNITSLASLFQKKNGYSFDVKSEIAKRGLYSSFLNMLADGKLVTKEIRDVIPSSIKIAIVKRKDYNSTDLLNRNGVTFLGTLPAVKVDDFSEDSINYIGDKLKIVNGKNLWNFMNSQRKTYLTETKKDMIEDTLLQNADAKTLADIVYRKFRNDIDSGLNFLRNHNIPTQKIKKVSMLLKVYQDY